MLKQHANRFRKALHDAFMCMLTLHDVHGVHPMRNGSRADAGAQPQSGSDARGQSALSSPRGARGRGPAAHGGSRAEPRWNPEVRRPPENIYFSCQVEILYRSAAHHAALSQKNSNKNKVRRPPGGRERDAEGPGEEGQPSLA